jgi:hypothetical protein
VEAVLRLGLLLFPAYAIAPASGPGRGWLWLLENSRDHGLHREQHDSEAFLGRKASLELVQVRLGLLRREQGAEE